MNQMTPDKATKALETLSPELMAEYTAYFATIKPKTDEEIFKRGIFSHCSVHTSWKYNVRMYAMLKDLDWLGSRRWLRNLIEESQAGLVNNRTRYIWEFAANFWKNPDAYRRQENELWTAYRDRLQGLTLGLGHAKTSFFIELVHFEASGVSCFDTHMLQLYGLKGNQSPGLKTMNNMESHWLCECARLGLPPCNARWALWDIKQGRPGNSRYWSYILEEANAIPVPRQLKLFEMVA